MSGTRITLFALAILLVVALGWMTIPRTLPRLAPGPESGQEIDQGAYLVHAAGCISCHISQDNSPALSGGLALTSPFGVFHVPNITPDPETGIGGWSEADLMHAIKHGRSPGGRNYFPAFPYRAYRGMTDSDARAIARWVLAQPAVASPSPGHELPYPEWPVRLLMSGWNRLADLLEPDYPEYADAQVGRGAYLARNLGHCGECHTPRNGFGIPVYSQEFAGAPVLDGEASAIDTAALANWTEDDFAFFLFLGLKPDEEYVGGEMEAVIEHNTSPLTEEDRQAMAAFFVRPHP